MSTDAVEFYDIEQQELLWWLTLAFSILSFLSQLMIFCTYICLKLESPISESVDREKARSVHIFIVSISFYDMIRIIGNLIDAEYPYESDPTKCITQSVFVSFGALASFLLVAVISIVMTVSVFFVQTKSDAIVRYIHQTRAYILSLIFVLAVLAAFVPIEYWCSSEYHQYLRGVYILPLLLIYILIVICYLTIALYFACKSSLDVLGKNHFFRDLVCFPIILLCCWVFTVYRRIYNVVNKAEPSFAIGCIAVVSVSVYGFCNFVVYWLVMRYQYQRDDSEELKCNETDDTAQDTEMQAIKREESQN